MLLDLRLPDMEGFSIGEQLADDPATCGVPVIVLSAMERPDIIRRTRAAGCQYFVRKPYDPNVSCNDRGGTLLYNEPAAVATTAAVKEFLTTTFGLKP